MEEKSIHSTRKLIFTALGVALVFVCTAFVSVRLPIAANGGLIHLGNVPLFIIAILYGRWVGALAGGIGMGLFDIIGGWFLWAPFTFIIVGLMGYVVGAICEKRQGLYAYVLAFTAAGIIKLVGYYGAEGLIYGNWFAPLTSIPGNLIQVGLAAIITLPIIIKLKKNIRRP